MRYRKKPLEVCAEQFMDDAESMVRLCELGLDFVRVRYDRKEPLLVIDTLEGEMTAEVGDYIVRGIAGEFYPVKREIFERSYEAVEEQERR